jgi:hypothetical protein
MPTVVNPAKPDKFNSFSPTEYDNLSDEELAKLLRQCNVNVSPQVKPQAPKYTDLDSLVGSERVS